MDFSRGLEVCSMSSIKSSQEASPLQSTRQMLDDLDALMERMLSLPVGDNEELPPLPRDILKTPALSASLTLLDEPEPPHESSPLLDEVEESEEEEELASPRPRDQQLSPKTYFTPEPLPEEDSAEEDSADEDFKEASPALEKYYSESVEEELPPPLIQRSPTLISSSTFSKSPTVSIKPTGKPGIGPFLTGLWLQPLVWVNQVFDHGTDFLGPLGPGMRSEKGRTFLGLVGLVCLSLAGAWFLKDQMGWPR
jgi:hypothetical protein